MSGNNSHSHSLTSILNKFCASFFEYKLQKVVVIRNVKFGLFYRTVQLIIVVYFLSFIVWYKRGYQAKENPVGGVFFKLKGLDFVNVTDYDNNDDNNARVWDAADYIIPPVMNGAVFITTNAIITEKQAMAYCSEKIGNCTSDADCPPGSLLQGHRTGRCLKYTGTCEVFGWCPSQHNDAMPLPAKSVLTRARNFTVFVKNSVDFPDFKIKRRNVLDWMTKEYLETCIHDPKHHNMSLCPVFRIGDILKYAGCTTERIYTVGGAFAIDIFWQCNFDLPEEMCIPKYSFRQLDTGIGTDVEGYSVQYAHNYRYEGEARRMHIKAHGIKISVTVSGEGGSFSVYYLSMNMGSGLALFGLSSLLCEFILLHMAGQRAGLRQARVDHCDVGHRRGSKRKSSKRKAEEAAAAQKAAQESSSPIEELSPYLPTPTSDHDQALNSCPDSFLDIKSRPRIVKRYYGRMPDSPVSRETLI